PGPVIALEALREVARPVAFAILIIIIVFLPLFTLESLEGKMFKPLALTMCFAMLGSLLVAFTTVPVLCLMLLRGVKPKRDHIFFRYVIQVESGLEKLISLLKERGVMCRKPVFMPLHRITFSSECHITDNVFQRALSIPIYPSLSEGDTEYICDAVRGSFKQMS
ncbi:MAG: efflux RND transporter permease subunit, partial [Fidelibacterota bacterium]